MANDHKQADIQLDLFGNDSLNIAHVNGRETVAGFKTQFDASIAGIKEHPEIANVDANVRDAIALVAVEKASGHINELEAHSLYGAINAAAHPEVGTGGSDSTTHLMRDGGPTSLVEEARAIVDAGEELVYNRRNRIKNAKQWSDISHLNDSLKVKETVKANIWLKPDYEKLIADGMKPMVAHMVKQVYDSVAAKPVIGGRDLLDDAMLQRYIAGVNMVETGLMKWASDTEALKQWAAANATVAGAMLGRRVNLGDIANENRSLLGTVYPGGWKEYRSEVMVAGGQKLLNALNPQLDEIKRALKAIDKGWPAKREAWEIQGFRVAENPEIKVHENSHRAGSFMLWVDGKYVGSSPNQDEAQAMASVIKPFVLFGKRGMLDSFNTEEEAIEGAKERAKRDKGKLIGDIGVRVEAVVRKGANRRLEGEDISSERLMNEFGFKGVNFGNWMKTPSARAEAQLHLNHAFDSFHDLAEIMRVPPKALSLNGMLGIAIGAQGSGGFAAAHFMPGVNEINITRTMGAGSLAHEWGHALDHYFAIQAGLATSSEPFLTEHVEMSATKTFRKNADGKMIIVEEPRFGELRPAIIQAFKSIVDGMDRRMETIDEAISERDARLVKERTQVKNWLKSIRRDYVGQEEAFDVLAARIESGDVGEGHIAASKNTYISPVVAEMRDLYKQKHGRVYSLENSKGLQAWIDTVAYRQAKITANEVHVPQMVSSNYARAARALDKEKGGKPYWATKLEKFARAFDAFVSDELERNQSKNGYLSHTGRDGNTVPMGSERQTVNDAFHGLLAEVQVRDTERGPVLFSVGDDKEEPAGLSLAAINAEILRLKKTWRSMPPVKVVNTVDELPFESPANADGLYCKKGVYVVADNIADLKQLQKVMAHECVLHHSLLDMLGNYGFSKLHVGLQKLKKEGDPVVSDLARDIRRRYGELSPHDETRELIASAGEKCLDRDGNIRVGYGFMKGVFAKVAGWFRDKGFNIPFSNTELQGIMHNAGQWVKRDRVQENQRPALRADKMDGAVLNSFAGVKAEGAPLEKLTLARSMQVAGIDDRKIWKETGWTFGFADGKPRFEISDSESQVVVRAVYDIWQDMRDHDGGVHNIGEYLHKYPDSHLSAEYKSKPPVVAAYENVMTDDLSSAKNIDSYLSHEELYSAYPEVTLVRAAKIGNNKGMERIESGEAYLTHSTNIVQYSKIIDSEQFHSTTLHELQHVIQGLEGFARGGNPDAFMTLDLTEKELSRINQEVHKLYGQNPAFYRDAVKATQLQIAVNNKYGSTIGDPEDPLIKQWWAAIDKRDAYPESKAYFALKSQACHVARDRVIVTPEEQYKRLAGEVEARLTQSRHNMSDEERLAAYPVDGMDVPVKEQMVKYGGVTDRRCVADGIYNGQVVDIANGVVLQKKGRGAEVVRHAESRLSKKVAIGEVVDIVYCDGQGQVGPKDLGRDLAR